VNTGIEIKAGKSIIVVATGSVNSLVYGNIDPDGLTTSDHFFFVKRERGYALYAKAGENGAPFYVGRDFLGMIGTGILYFAINSHLHYTDTGYFVIDFLKVGGEIIINNP
jgi:hypothetical protein